MASYYDFGFYPRSTPRSVKGGIRSQSRRGRGARSWWAERWMAVLDGFMMGARLSRGRTYANKGQVASLDMKGGEVTAQVQGSRGAPYDVRIKVKQLTESQWGSLAEELSRRPAVAAELLAGRMPKSMEDLFRGAGHSLFPGTDMDTDCSCPDWANPCKHIAAVYILLGDEFERDPFVLFRMRGSGRDRILEMAGLRDLARAEADAAEPPRPLPEDPAEFWGKKGADAADATGAAVAPVMAAALPRRLGAFPLWRGGKDFLATMEDAYRAASPAGVDAFAGGDSGRKKAKGPARTRRRA